MDTPLQFSDWIRQLRVQQDLTQEGLAEQVGCSVTMMLPIEGERRRPSRAMAERLAAVLQVAPEQRATFVAAARAVGASIGEPAPARTAASTTGRQIAPSRTPNRADWPCRGTRRPVQSPERP